MIGTRNAFLILTHSRQKIYGKQLMYEIVAAKLNLLNTCHAIYYNNKYFVEKKKKKNTTSLPLSLQNSFTPVYKYLEI